MLKSTWTRKYKSDTDGAKRPNGMQIHESQPNHDSHIFRMINKLAQNPTQQRIDSFLNETNHGKIPTIPLLPSNNVSRLYEPANESSILRQRFWIGNPRMENDGMIFHIVFVFNLKLILLSTILKIRFNSTLTLFFLFC